MSAPFTIDIWSDLVCPFCAIGHRQLLEALASFEHADQVVIQFRAFELDPTSPPDYGRPLAELVARKYGMPTAQSEAFHHRLEAEAASLGLAWDMGRARCGNTRDAHRLVALAARQGLARATVERLFAAYFGEGRLLADHPTLVELADEVGVEGAADLLATDALTDEVLADEADAVDLGISGVPAFLLDRRFMVNGAQGVAEMLDVLQRAWARREAVPAG